MRQISGWGWTGALVIVAAARIGLVSPAAFSQTDSLIDESSESETHPTPSLNALQIAGIWDGTIQDSDQGPGTISFVFTSSKSNENSLEGTWTINFPRAPIRGAINDAGRLTSSVTSREISITLHPRPGAAFGKCELVFKSDSASADGISGSYQFGACEEGNTGMIAIAPRRASDLFLVNIGGDFFFPKKLKIRKGQTVRWTNNDSDDHSVDAHPDAPSPCKPNPQTVHSGRLRPGDTFERTFHNAGVFNYHCDIHGCLMRGTIKVK